MKHNFIMRTLIIGTIAAAGLLSSCEQESFEPNTSAMPGGGTVTTYKAYTLGTPDTEGEDIYGRIVFYKYSSKVTLVQMGLYNTDPDKEYASEIYTGALTDALTIVSMPLDRVDGASGAFATFKYFTISDDKFFDGLSAYNANVKVKLGEAVVVAGDIGANADPVEEQE